jgi:hypothetical protein
LSKELHQNADHAVRGMPLDDLYLTTWNNTIPKEEPVVPRPFSARYETAGISRGLMLAGLLQIITIILITITTRFQSGD